MKKIILSSLTAMVCASAASATTITPYAGINLGYERATFNDLVVKTIWDGETEKSHMGNIMGNGFTMGVAGGFAYRATDIIGLRAELEYMYSHNNNMDLDYTETYTEEDESGDILEMTKTERHTFFDADTHALMVNLYADFHNSTAFTPYISAGLGYSWTDLQQDTNDEQNLQIKDSGLAWQIGAGVAYSMTDTLSLDLGYRFVKLVTIEDSESYADGDMDKFEITPMMHQVRLGARYTF